MEQKNDSLVHAYLGCDHFDTVAQTNLLNHLYEKIVLPAEDGHPARSKRRYDKARDCLCATGKLDDGQCQPLQALRDAANPRQLRQQIYDLLNQLFALPNALPGSIQDVYLTLFDLPEFVKGQADCP